MLSRNPIEETTFSFSGETPAPKERQEGAKRLTTLRVGTVTIGGRRELCLIRNISAGGLKAHVYSDIKIGDAVSFELKTNQQTAGKVSWVQDGSVGVTFDQAIDVEELLASHLTTDGGWQPRMPRVEVDRLGELRIGAVLYPINTCDISQGGVRIEIDHDLRVGERVVLSLEKFRPIEGTVRWYQDHQAGIAFNHVIPFQELMGWLRA